MPRYRIIDLHPVGGLESRALGLNDSGEVVGRYTTAGGEVHAFLWLPAPILEGTPGQLCEGFHDLAALSSCGGSAAYDINLAREIAGESGAFGPPDQWAVVWKLTSSGVRCTTIPRLSGGTWNFARALNDQDPPQVVGQSQFFLQGCGLVERGFRATVDLDVQPPVVGEVLMLPPEPGKNSSDGRDVNDVLDQLGLPRIAGVSYSITAGPCVNDQECDPSHDAAIWYPVSELPKPPGALNGAEAQGSNQGNKVVGWWLNNGDPCLQRAMYWDPTQNPAVLAVLGEVEPIDPAHETHPPAVVDVVCFLELPLVLPVADELELLSEWGPCLSCPMDLDGDDVVGITDLLHLLGGWGACTP